MIINKHTFFFDVGRQAYIEILRETQEVKVVTKEHIKKVLFEELGKTTEFFDRIKNLYNEIEIRHVLFDPHKEQTFNQNGYVCQNTYIELDIFSNARKIRLETPPNKLIRDINFISKYPHIKALLQNLFTDDNRIYYFINWIARAFIAKQKNQTAILLRGIQGTGKGVLWEQIIEYAVGSPYCATTGDEDFKQFNSIFENKLFILGNEIKGDFRDGNITYEKIKKYISDNEISIENKGVDRRKIINYFNMIFFSNNATPLQIQAGDRRYTVYETKTRTLKNVANIDFNENLETFISNIQKERDGFIEDLFLFDFDTVLAMTAQDTPEKERIYRASITKIEILADKINSLDYSFFENDIVEICENMNFDKLKVLFLENNMCMHYRDDMLDLDLTLKANISDEIRKIPKTNCIANSVLVFLYKIFVNEIENMTKLGTALNLYFGPSRVTRNNKKPLRVRDIKLSENKTITLDEDGEPIPF